MNISAAISLSYLGKTLADTSLHTLHQPTYPHSLSHSVAYATLPDMPCTQEMLSTVMKQFIYSFYV